MTYSSLEAADQAAISSAVSAIFNVEPIGSRDLDLCDQFRTRLEFVAAIANKQGLDLKPYESSSLPVFSSLPLELKETVLNSIDFFVTVCNETLAAGEDAVTSQQLTWRAMRHFGFLPSQDLIARITSDDIVEIFDLNHVQIFRNFQFYRYSSYHLEDLYCRPWMELFRRPDPSVAMKLGQTLIEALTVKARGLIELEVGEHLVEETCSPKMNRYMLNVMYGSLLFDTSKQARGFAVVERARFVPKDH